MRQRERESAARKVRVKQTIYQINPVTRKKFTDAEIGEMLGIHYETAGKIRRQLGVNRYPNPVVSHDPVPANELAFGLGLVTRNYNVAEVYATGYASDPDKGFILVTAQARDQRKHALLIQTLGRRGEVRENVLKTRVYLSKKRFRSLLDPDKAVQGGFLDAEKRYAPYVSALLAANLSSKEGRFSLNGNPDLFDEICDRFLKFYDFPIGKVEKVKHRTKRAVLVDPKALLALASTSSVNSLSFFRDLGSLDALSRSKKLDENGASQLIAELHQAPVEVPAWLSS